MQKYGSFHGKYCENRVIRWPKKIINELVVIAISILQVKITTHKLLYGKDIFISLYHIDLKQVTH